MVNEIVNLNALYRENSKQDLEIVLFEVNSNPDNRGELIENFKQSKLREVTKQDFIPKQQNLVLSKKHVFRGIHKSTTQNKLVSCLKGSIIDITVDMRENSPNFGTIYIARLTETDRFNLFVPKDFGHSYYCLSNNSLVSYLLDGEYETNFEQTWNARHIINRIKEIDQNKIVMSLKDLTATNLFLE